MFYENDVSTESARGIVFSLAFELECVTLVDTNGPCNKRVQNEAPERIRAHIPITIAKQDEAHTQAKKSPRQPNFLVAHIRARSAPVIHSSLSPLLISRSLFY